MDVFISAAATKLAELTVEPIVRQVRYLLSYRNNLKELEDQVKKLKETKEHIDEDVGAERRNGREIGGDVLNWQKDVIKTLKEAEELCQDEAHASIRCYKWSFPNLKSRHQLGRKTKKLADKIVQMEENGRFERGVGYFPHLDITSNFSTTRGSDKLESRNIVKKDIVLSLKDPKVNRIGVYGISGVGKTTLVKEVAKQVKDDKLFDAVVMVTISQTNLERIQDEIAEQLGLHALKEMTSSIGRANFLCKRIKKEKTILIILDDLREKIDLEKLGIPFLDTWGKINSEKVEVPLKDDSRGCKLLLTSRDQSILQMNDTQKNFPLQVLNEKESWSLFEAMVGDVVKDANFQTIATQVAQRCAGFPVLIVTIAKSLKSNTNIYYWQDTLNNLKGVDNRDMRGTLFSALEFNFNRLEDEVKKVFLLCGVHGTSIFVSDLFKYAIGLGIFKSINTIEDARNRLYRIIYDLKASCLLVDDEARAEMIKMNDIICEVAVLIASKDVFTKSNAKLQDWPRKDILEKCTHIILDCCCIQKLPERLDCPLLKFLHINSTDNRTLEVPDSFFEGMRNLEALDLTGLIMSSLPTSLNCLTKLKTLCLDHCSLKDMTGIGALINLEILSLIHSSMEEFPREIEKLTKLRMLDLSRSGIGTTLPNTLCKLIKIEELYMGNATINWEVESSTKQKRNASLGKLGHLTGLTNIEIQIREAWLLPKDIPFDKLKRYKVVIGDKWEWSNNKETSRLLKAKLDTSIHWERGIKTLIKRVEDLYLDKISGISNVLFELNGEGFPLLKHLHIQNNGEIQHIINSKERNQTHVLFPELESLALHKLNSLVKIWHGPVRDNSFGKLKVFKVKSCHQLVYLFSVSLVKAFSQLVEIEVSECSSMKKIVSLESADNGKIIDDKVAFLPLRILTLQHLPSIGDFCSRELTKKQNLLGAKIPAPFFSAKVIFSNLETLKVSSLNLKKIWDDEQSSTPHLVQNLANLTVEDCNGLMYLFSASMVGKLSNLKQLEISKCDMMEQIIATEEINVAALGEVLLPKLEAITIKDMQNLKTIWHPILASNSLACFKTLKVKNCEKIEKIFPEYMNGAFATLETLMVKDCKSVQEILEMGVNADDTTQLKYVTLLQLPQLKQIWSRDPQSSLRFKNLQVVRVEDCGELEYLFPFSIAKHLPQLEAITVNNAEKMKEIVSTREEETLDNSIKFEFNQLTSMVLWNLQNLQGFCAGNHSLSCSSLKKLDACNCKKLKLFKTQSTSSHERRLSDNYLHVSTQQPLFPLEEVIDNLEILRLNNDDASLIFQSQVPRDQFRKLSFLGLYELADAQATSPYWFLQNISSLEWLVIQENSFKVIFPDERPQDENGEIDIKTRLKKLTLYKLYDLQHICKEGCKLDPVLEVLEYLHVDECPNLKNLVPSSVTFNHLTYLRVQNCKGLIYLITSTAARNLVKLKTFKIRGCGLVELIVEEEGGESKNEIEFNSLQVLELEYLSKLNSFGSRNCSLKLPLLEKLVIRKCPRMKTFSASGTSAPLLREILTDEQDEKWFCDGDLNSTMNKIFQHMVAFRSTEHLELSQYPELGGDVWCSHVQLGVFGKLKDLIVHKCDFLSKVLLPLNLLKGLSNLEKLQVSECDSLEAIFDVNALDDKSKEVSPLKMLTLSRLSNLKRIWNREVGEINSFGNLQTVEVDECQHLKYLFSSSLCQDLRQLEELGIESCGVEQIVADEEGLEELNFCFPLLRVFMLIDLKQLKDFYPKRYTLECPSLKALNIYGCEELQIFAFDHLNSQPVQEGNIALQIERALFYIEKVPQNLELLALNEEDAIRIFNANYEKNLFQSIKTLSLQCFQETPIKFLNVLIQKFPVTTTVQVHYSSFETLFPSKEIGHCSIGSATQIKTLGLCQLEQLKHIWNDDDSTTHPLVQNLEELYIVECSRITRLAPPSASFKNLTSLEVEDCHGLKFLMTSCTAKSLVHLTSLEVSNCGMLEEVVMTDEGGAEEEITFESLEYLELNHLSGFKSFCSRKHMFIFPSLVTLEVIGCHKMQNFSYGVIIAPFLKLVEVENGKKRWKDDLNTTIQQLFIDKAIGEGVEGGDYKESSNINIQCSQTHQESASTSRAISFEEHGAESKATEIVDSGKQEMHKLPIPRTGLALGTQDETNESPLVQATDQGTLSPGIVRDTDIRISVSVAQNVPSSSTVDNIDGLQDLQLHPSENLLVQTTTSIMNDNEENIGTKEMHETIQRRLVQNVDEDMLIPASVHEIATWTHETIDKPFVHATLNTWDITIVQEREESHENSDIHLSKNLFNQTITSMAADYKENVGTQERDESKRRFMFHDTDGLEITLRNNLSSQATNSVMAENKAAPSQASKAPSSSTTPVADVCSILKELDISLHLLPYLEAGVNRHPQVLDWLNTKRRTVFASSFISLFAEVTRILKTTRRVNLTEDDRNYIRECCAALQGVGFDDEWISYVHGHIEECGDGEDLEGRVKEAETQLEFIEKELVLLRDKASRLHGYMCLSTLINALLFAILFFIIIYVYEKKN